ncbi:MAG: DUF3303 family protein [Phycisphaerales bacterium]|nr:DUF3303 family protein [Phycisphaerales bacterium]
MLYMVIERFKGGDPSAAGERFMLRGRLMPENSGLAYIASWMAADGSRCYQLMESPSRAALDPWIANWADLVDFEVVPVQSSADFWATRPPGPSR